MLILKFLKAISVGLVLIFALPTFASIECREVKDTQSIYKVQFNPTRSKEFWLAEMTISGEEKSSGSCKVVPNAIEFRIACTLRTKLHGEFDIALYSIGGASLYAEISGGDFFQPLPLNYCDDI